MAKYKVWDVINCSEETAMELEADDEMEAAIMYVEEDVDGQASGLYTKEGGMPLDNITRDGHPVHVRDEDGVLTRWHVGVIEFEPTFAAVHRPIEETDRCEHGMYFTGAGACPQCGRGAD
jgi:hypothetical protein